MISISSGLLWVCINKTTKARDNSRQTRKQQRMQTNMALVQAKALAMEVCEKRLNSEYVLKIEPQDD